MGFLQEHLIKVLFLAFSSKIKLYENFPRFHCSLYFLLLKLKHSVISALTKHYVFFVVDIAVTKNTSVPPLWSPEAERSHSLSQHTATSSKKPAFNLSAFGTLSPVSTD